MRTVGFTSYISDIKRQTNFPPKPHGRDKRLLNWNVSLSFWGSMSSFVLTVNTNTFSFKSWNSSSYWILLNISLKSQVQIAMHESKKNTILKINKVINNTKWVVFWNNLGAENIVACLSQHICERMIYRKFCTVYTSRQIPNLSIRDWNKTHNLTFNMLKNIMSLPTENKDENVIYTDILQERRSACWWRWQLCGVPVLTLNHMPF